MLCLQMDILRYITLIRRFEPPFPFSKFILLFRGMARLEGLFAELAVFFNLYSAVRVTEKNLIVFIPLFTSD